MISTRLLVMAVAYAVQVEQHGGLREAHPEGVAAGWLRLLVFQLK